MNKNSKLKNLNPFPFKRLEMKPLNGKKAERKVIIYKINRPSKGDFFTFKVNVLLSKSI